jgi:cytochrome c biogenesis protein CcmG/thiol:disulfide interchange protein DsbE
MKFLIALYSLLLLAACSGTDIAVVNIGDTAPQFDTVRLNGTPAHYPTGWAGKSVAINFWAEGCGACESEMAAIERVYRRQKDKGFDVLAVNVNQGPEQVAAFMKTVAMSYPILLDQEVAIAKRYGVVALPTTFFVDGKGVVRGKLIGEIEEAQFEKHALEVLK